MAGFIIFFLIVSYVLSKALGYNLSFVGVMLIISGLMSFGSYYYSDSIVLAMSGAKQIQVKDNPELFHIVENLSIASGLPMPRVFIINDPAPNAFATGRDPKHAAVAATTGILERLSRIELEGVIGHEMSHVKNYDTRLMGVVAILVGSLSILADFFFRSLWFRGDDNNDRGSNQLFMLIGIILAILSPIIAMLIQLALSRSREYLADADGALLTRNPDALASALAKIAADPHMLKNASTATAHFYIENPFKTDSKRKPGQWFAGMFSTHPPIEERIKTLHAM